MRTVPTRLELTARSTLNHWGFGSTAATGAAVRMHVERSPSNASYAGRFLSKNVDCLAHSGHRVPFPAGQAC
eukprot:3702879-Rhodomonas_salina.2